jgi:carboxyl-terminal processing protease
MQRISRVGLISLVIVGVSSLLGGLFGGSVAAGNGQVGERLRSYTQLLQTIQDEYVEETTSERLVAASVGEMLHTLDPHSDFLEPREHTALQERQRGSYYGLGITVQAIDGNITVVSPFEGSPAHRLGIRAGDIISRIDAEDARGMTIDDAVRRLRGPKGTSVKLTIARRGYESPLEFTVIRDEISLHSVPYAFMATPHTGYVRLVDFNETTACRPGAPATCEKELERAIRTLKEQGARSLILDIRDNPGGLLDQSFAVSNLFLGKGQLVVFTRGRSARDESNYITEGESRYTDLPLILLTSAHSASASEIVAGAIQDHDRGLIVGERTFGKGLVQTILPLHNLRGYALSLTTARYYTPSGRSIQRDYGVTALEDYYSASARPACEAASGEPKLTEAGRKVYGGGGIAPDYCVEPQTPAKFIAYLDSRRAFFDFSMLYEAEDTIAAGQVGTAGERPQHNSTRVRAIRRDFDVDSQVWDEFRAFLVRNELRFTDEDLSRERAALRVRILDEVLRQVFGEREARQRSVEWDPQVRKALEVLPQAELLLRSPEQLLAESAAQRRNVQP